MSDSESRLAAALQADMAPARDASFRSNVLVRLERARFRRRVALAAAGAAVATLLAAASVPVLESWMMADPHHVWISIGAMATLSALSGVLIASSHSLRAGVQALQEYL